MELVELTVKLVKLTVDFTEFCDSISVGLKEMPCWSQKRVKSSQVGGNKEKVGVDGR